MFFLNRCQLSFSLLNPWQFHFDFILLLHQFIKRLTTFILFEENFKFVVLLLPFQLMLFLLFHFFLNLLSILCSFFLLQSFSVFDILILHLNFPFLFLFFHLIDFLLKLLLFLIDVFKFILSFFSFRIIRRVILTFHMRTILLHKLFNRHPSNPLNIGIFPRPQNLPNPNLKLNFIQSVMGDLTDPVFDNRFLMNRVIP